LPDADYRGSVCWHKAFYGFSKVVLETGTPKLAIREDINANLLLPLQRLEDGLVLGLAKLAPTYTAFPKCLSGLFDSSGPQ
jgi:hypothetical protein